jgi:hypothetical protein
MEKAVDRPGGAGGKERPSASRAASPAAGRNAFSPILELQSGAGNQAFQAILLRAAATGEEAEAPAPEPVPEGPAPEAAPSPALIAEDETETVGPGQMKKSEFLAALRPEVCAAAEAGLAGTEHSAQGCPFIDFWFNFYERQSVERMNRDLPRFTGEGPAPATAADYIPLIAERVRASVAVWAETGEITGLPAGIPLPGMGLGILGALGGALFKARDSGPASAENPATLRARLGSGNPLDSGLRSRMESVFRQSFAHVRVHTDDRAAGISDHLNAKAFTVGEHVAFGSREYRPGTPEGEALIAHELAHVVQQSASGPSVASARVTAPESAALEADADRAASGAVASLWGWLPGMDARPGRSSGLRLQRCSGSQKTATTTPQPSASAAMATPSDCSALSPETWGTGVKAAEKLSGDSRRDAMVALVRRALCGTGLRLRVAGNSHSAKVHPDDYDQAPVVNFDINLPRKEAWTSKRLLDQNVGYYFARDSKAFAILGPKAVDDKSPAFTRMYAEHELFHTEHHLPGGTGAEASYDDQELEAWTNDFRNYFHQTHRIGTQWSPLIGYYEQATPPARAAALTQLVAYYNNPPVPAEQKPAIQRAFGRWLQRRLADSQHATKALIVDLEARLHLGSKAGRP